MATVWFWLVLIMILIYVVLDGFDLGAGILHLFVARTEAERSTVMRSIGPVWKGNEVWLLARRGDAFLCLPSPLRHRLQWLLPPAHDGALAAHRPRARHRVQGSD